MTKNLQLIYTCTQNGSATLFKKDVDVIVHTPLYVSADSHNEIQLAKHN